MSARRDLELAGGAALTAGLVLGFMAERLRRFAPPADARPVPAVREKPDEPAFAPREEAPTADLLERYRLAAAV
jgi:hypothetical protein